MARKKKDPEIKRNEFIAVAKKLFFAQGYENTSMQDILKAVGGDSPLSPSVFYYYFRSKEELLEATINDYMNDYTCDLIKVIEIDNISYPEKMKQSLAIIKRAVDDFTKVDTYFDAANIQSQYFNWIIDMNVLNIIRVPLEKLVEEALENGIIKKTPLFEKVGTKMIIQMLLNAILPIFHQGRGEDGQHHSEKYIDIIPLLFTEFLGFPKVMFDVE
ncbi:MAG: TetR/AcrR family transcriptional regulator [Syntrophomonas sp.]